MRGLPSSYQKKKPDRNTNMFRMTNRIPDKVHNFRSIKPPFHFQFINHSPDSYTLAQVYQQAVNYSRIYFGISDVYLLLIDKDPGGYFLVQNYRNENGQTALDLPLLPVRENFLQILQKGACFVIDNVNQTPNLNSILPHSSINSLYCFPLKYAGEICGIWAIDVHGKTLFKKLKNEINIFLQELCILIHYRKSYTYLLLAEQEMRVQHNKMKKIHEKIRFIQSLNEPQIQLQFVADNIRNTCGEIVFLTFRDLNENISLIHCGMDQRMECSLKDMLNRIPDFEHFLIDKMASYAVDNAYYLLWKDRASVKSFFEIMKQYKCRPLLKLVRNNNLIILPMHGIENEIIGLVGIIVSGGKLEQANAELDYIQTFIREAAVIIRKQILYLRHKKLAHELCEINRHKNLFLASLSHELKTPLTSICGFASTLLDDSQVSPEEQKNYLHIIQQEGLRLSRMIDQLLEFAKIESGKFYLKLEPVYLNNVIQTVLFSLQKSLEEKNIRLILHPIQKPLVLFADKDKIIQVLYNIIGNAIKFTPKKGKISFHIKLNKKTINLIIKDSGIGISGDEIKKIFDTFYRGHSNGNSISGSGIGLSVAKQIIDAHGGSISVKSVVNQGSAFTIKLPFSYNSAQTNFEPAGNIPKIPPV